MTVFGSQGAESRAKPPSGVESGHPDDGNVDFLRERVNGR
jgi:hypothetical protein